MYLSTSTNVCIYFIVASGIREPLFTLGIIIPKITAKLRYKFYSFHYILLLGPQVSQKIGSTSLLGGYNIRNM